MCDVRVCGDNRVQSNWKFYKARTIVTLTGPYYIYSFLYRYNYLILFIKYTLVSNLENMYVEKIINYKYNDLNCVSYMLYYHYWCSIIKKLKSFNNEKIVCNIKFWGGIYTNYWTPCKFFNIYQILKSTYVQVCSNK